MKPSQYNSDTRDFSKLPRIACGDLKTSVNSLWWL